MKLAPLSVCQYRKGGGVLGQNEVFIDSYSLCVKFSGAFYGIEKAFSVVQLSRDEFSKNGKILYILGIFKFSIGDLKSYLIFGPRSVSGPHIWPSGCIWGVFQTLFGNFWDFEIFGHFWGPEVQKSRFFAILPIFCVLMGLKMAENLKISKIPK